MSKFLIGNDAGLILEKVKEVKRLLKGDGDVDEVLSLLSEIEDRAGQIMETVDSSE